MDKPKKWEWEDWLNKACRDDSENVCSWEHFDANKPYWEWLEGEVERSEKDFSEFSTVAYMNGAHDAKKRYEARLKAVYDEVKRHVKGNAKWIKDWAARTDEILKMDQELKASKDKGKKLEKQLIDNEIRKGMVKVALFYEMETKLKDAESEVENAAIREKHLKAHMDATLIKLEAAEDEVERLKEVIEPSNNLLISIQDLKAQLRDAEDVLRFYESSLNTNQIFDNKRATEYFKRKS